MPNIEYDPTAWSRIPEYGEDMADGRFHQPAHLVPTIQGFTKPGDAVLEVGCGGQGYAGHFKGLGLRYTGLDITPEYLEIARSKYPEFRFVLGDARKMPFEDKSFAATFCNNVFLHLGPDDVMKVFNEMVRVSKRAVLVISRFGEEDRSDLQTSTYPEADGTFAKFLYNTYSYARFRVPGWVTYTAPPTSLLLVSTKDMEIRATLEGLQREFPNEENNR